MSHLCYCYFRLGKTTGRQLIIENNSLAEYILAGLFLCTVVPDQMLQQLKPEWNELVHLPVEEKCVLLNKSFSNKIFFALPLVFPWQEALSNGIEYDLFCASFFIQPDLFIRVRPGYEKSVTEKLNSAQLPYQFLNKHCIALPNNTKIDTVIEPDAEAVIQDYSSQRVAELLTPAQQNKKITVWDCCAASGGKSILAKDVLGDIDLTVSDIREAILSNLKRRFTAAGIRKYRSVIANLAQPLTIQHSAFDLIICDVPCSGSGTWSRTPEQLYYWKEEDVLDYTTLQKKIVSNVISSVKPGGYLLYITCSVFKKENEDIIHAVIAESGLQPVKMELLKGYDKKADTMFAALLYKESLS